MIIPRGLRIDGSTAFALPRGQQDMARWLDVWIEVKRKNGTLERLERYWILGQREKQDEPRWSIMKDVLGWKGSEEAESRAPAP